MAEGPHHTYGQSVEASDVSWPGVYRCIVGGTSCTWAQQIRPVTEDRAESCPVAVVGALTVSMDSHGCRVLPCVRTWQWRLVMGIRPACAGA